MPLICAHGGLHGGVGQERGASFPNTVSAFVAASRGRIRVCGSGRLEKREITNWCVYTRES